MEAKNGILLLFNGNLLISPRMSRLLFFKCLFSIPNNNNGPSFGLIFLLLDFWPGLMLQQETVQTVIRPSQLIHRNYIYLLYWLFWAVLTVLAELTVFCCYIAILDLWVPIGPLGTSWTFRYLLDLYIPLGEVYKGPPPPINVGGW